MASLRIAVGLVSMALIGAAMTHWLLKRPHIKARIEKLAAEMRE